MHPSVWRPPSFHPTQPRSISARRMGVGAVLWDGSLALAAYLARQPLHRYVGLRWVRRSLSTLPHQSYAVHRCLELGAGVGLVGLTLTAMGAKVYITDKEAVLPLTRRNAMHNGHDPETTCGNISQHAALLCIMLTICCGALQPAGMVVMCYMLYVTSPAWPVPAVPLQLCVLWNGDPQR